MTEGDSDKRASREHHRQYLLQLHSDMARDYDKLVTTISAGGIGLALLFLRESNQQLSASCWAIWGCFLFVGSLFSILLSYLLSQVSSEATVRRMDAGEDEETKKETWLDRGIVLLNVLAFLSLIAGAVSLSYFVVQNV